MPGSAASHRLDLLVDEAELARRREGFTPPSGVGAERGWRRLWRDHVLQAEEGVDLDILRGA